MNTFTQEQKDHWLKLMLDYKEPTGPARAYLFSSATDRQQSQLPIWLLKLGNEIYKNLRDNQYIDLPLQLLNAIPTETEITSVYSELAIRRLNDLGNSVREGFPKVYELIQGVIEYYKKRGENADWEEARRHAAHAVAHVIPRVYTYGPSYAYPDPAAGPDAAPVPTPFAFAFDAKESFWRKERDNLLECLNELS